MPSKSCDLKILNTSTLKKVIVVCIPATTRVINLSLDRREFCTNWQNTVIKLLIKSKQKGAIKSNYWWVNNLSLIWKVVEKCALEQFNKHCNGYDLLPEYQSTHRRYCSCETSLLKLINDILWNMENKLVTAVTIYDLSHIWYSGSWPTSGSTAQQIWNKWKCT